MLLFLKNLAFTVLVPGTVAGFLPWYLFGPYQVAALAMAAGGALMVLAGIALYLACIWPFAATGRGTPAPIDPPREVIVTGPYRFVRNPMYIAALLAIFGQALLFGEGAVIVYGLCIGAVFFLFVVGCEEPVLGDKFGEAYTTYQDTVPRWIPRWPKAH